MSFLYELVKDYFLFWLILFLFSYLTPKDEYRKFFQFFVGTLMAVILLRPVLAFLNDDPEDQVRENIERMISEMEQIEFEEEGEDQFEWFYEHEGMDHEKTGKS